MATQMHHSQIHGRNDAFLLFENDIVFGLIKIVVRHFHSALSQRQQPSLCAHRLEICSTEIVLGRDEVLKHDVVGQSHFLRVNAKDFALRFEIGQWKLNLAVESAWSQQRRVQRLNLVGRHDHFDLATLIEAVELVEQLEHGALNLALSARRRLVAFGADRVNLIDEHDRGRVLVRDTEQLAHQFGSVAEILLNEFRADHAQEGGRCLVRHRLRQQRLARAWRAIQNHALRRLDPDVLVNLGMRHRQLHRLFDLLDLLLETANVGIRLERRLVHLHHVHHGVSLVAQDAHHREHFVVEQHGARRLQQVLVDKRQNVDVVLRAHGGAHNAMILVDELLQRANDEWRARHLLNLVALLFVALFFGLDRFLVRDKLLLQQQPVIQTVKTQFAQFTPRQWHNGRQFGRRRRPFPFLAANV
mmetsp:Transcript_23050/g.36941  ORF Transcript_23050/g.36941 Transcript_23050/m.36941 type:complete len:416 (+) Transcript_23050:163-1410(+)